MTQSDSGTGAENTRGASVYDSDQLQPEDTLDDRGVEDALDEGYSPPERPFQAEGYGTTPAEQQQGETLDMKLAEEEPDPAMAVPDPLDPQDDADGDAGEDLGDTSVDGLDEPGRAQDNLNDGEVGDDRAGRLVAPDEGAHEDTEPEMVGEQVGIDGGAASAEEAAMHVVDQQ